MFKSYDRKPLGCAELVKTMSIVLIATGIIYLATNGNPEKTKSDQDIVEGDVATLSSSPSLINGCQVVNQLSSDEYESISGIGAYDPNFKDDDGDGCAYNPYIIDQLFSQQFCQYGEVKAGSTNLEVTGNYSINNDLKNEQAIVLALRGICVYPDGQEMSFQREGRINYVDTDNDGTIDSLSVVQNQQ